MLKLPVDSFLDQILASLIGNDQDSDQKNNQRSYNLVISAAPGAGKTTKVPLALANSNQISGQVLVLEPRRVAAMASATHVANLDQSRLGEKVGYQVRYESKTSAQTKLIFLTEALLAKKLMSDPMLTGVSVVVLDEFHERSLHTDLAIGLLQELQMLHRPDLKIVVMSATMDAKKISDYLNQAPIIDVPGQVFDLQIHKLQKSQLLTTGPDFIERVCEVTREALTQTSRHILVFLPGVGEIERTYNKLNDSASLKNKLLLPLHGQLSLEEQRRVLEPSSTQKIILATNIAESSLTIDGLDTVIDCGLQRQMIFDARTGHSRMETQRISKASAKQRAGRAARQFPGRVFQLWTTLDERSMTDFDQAEIFRSDLAEVLLILAKLDVTNPESFSWFEKPVDLNLQKALQLLKNIGAINAAGSLTEIGEQMSRWPVSPRAARILVEAEKLNELPLACDVVALLTEKDLQRDAVSSNVESDLLYRWEIFNTHRSQSRYGALEKASSHLLNLSRARRSAVDTSASGLKKLMTSMTNILWPAFNDRLARRRRPQDLVFQWRTGAGATLADQSAIRESEFILALQSTDEQIRWAHGVPKEKIDQHFKSQYHKEETLMIDEASGRLVRREKLLLDAMPMQNPIDRPASDEDVRAQLPLLAWSRWTDIKQKNEALQIWVERYEWFALKTQSLALSEDWIRAALEQACFSENKLESLFQKDLIYYFESLMDPQVRSDFHQSAPEKITVPTGNSYRIKYLLHQNPHLEVRLQEVFGWSKTPTILKGTVPVTLHLLAPNYRPVQVTSDLNSFWKNGYPEVRKELRARYPKHSWPDDPLTATPESKGRRR